MNGDPDLSAAGGGHLAGPTRRSAVAHRVGRHGADADAFGIDHPRGLYVVADGMGATAKAAAAARLAVAHALERAGDELEAGHLAETVLDEATKAAGRAVWELADARSPGTTLCVTLVTEQRIWVANVGDSRCYAVRSGALQLLTADHSEAFELIAQGAIGPRSVLAERLRNSLTRYLGQAAAVSADVTSVPVDECQRVALCTDGAWATLQGERLTRLLCATDEPAASIAESIAAAAADSGDDDITVVVVDLPPSTTTPSASSGGPS